jgi:DNA-binding transcriptional MerR regulator
MGEISRISFARVSALLLMVSSAFGTDLSDINFSIEDIKKKIEKLPEDSEEYISISACLNAIEKLMNEIDKEKGKGENADSKTITSLQDKLEEQKAEIRRITEEIKERSDRNQFGDDVFISTTSSDVGSLESIDYPSKRKKLIRNQAITIDDEGEESEREPDD